MRNKQRRLVTEMLQDIYGQVDFLPTPLLTKLGPLLARAQQEMEKELRDWLATENGAARFTAQRLRIGLIRTRRAMERIKKSINPEIMRGLRIGSGTAGQLATRNIERELIKFGEIFGEMISPAQLDTAALIAKGDKLLVNKFAASTARYSESIRGEIASQLALSKIRNETVAEATLRLQKTIPQVFRHARSRAETIVRTELMNAYNYHHELGIKELRNHDPDIRMRWDAYRDRRTCLQCASLDGQVIDVSNSRAVYKSSWESSAGKSYKATHERPPAHPCCRCVAVAWRKDWDADITREPMREKTQRRAA